MQSTACMTTKCTDLVWSRPLCPSPLYPSPWCGLIPYALYSPSCFQVLMISWCSIDRLGMSLGINPTRLRLQWNLSTKEGPLK